MTVLLFAGVLVAPPLVPVLFGPAFTESARALPVLFFAVGFYCVFIAYIPILNLRERTGGMLAASGAAAVLNLLGDLVLIPIWGILGAAWATVASQCAGAIVVAGLARREDRFSFGPVISFLAPLLIVVIGWTFSDGWYALLSASAAAILLAIAGRTHRLCSAPDLRLLASLDLPVFRKWLPVPTGERS
jgi:O-antigen/teichoic acid export membrane protein